MNKRRLLPAGIALLPSGGSLFYFALNAANRRTPPDPDIEKEDAMCYFIG